MGNISLNNYVIVKSLSDFPAPSAGIITLNNNFTYRISGTVNVGTNRIQLGISNLIAGLDKSDDKLVYTGTSSLIIGTNLDFSMNRLTVACVTGGGSVFGLNGTTNNLEISDCIFGTKSIGTISGAAVCIFRNNFITGTDSGITFSGVFSVLTISDNIAVNNTAGAFTTIGISGATINTTLITRNLFNTNAGRTSISYSTTTIGANGILDSNIFIGVGIYVAGLTYATANWTFKSNVNIANSEGIINRDAIYFNVNSGTTPTTTAGARTFFGDTGNSLITLSGATNRTNGCQTMFLVPDDYFSGGTIVLNYTTATGTGNSEITCVLTSTAVGQDFTVTSQTGLIALCPATTQFLKQSTSLTPNPANIVAGRGMTLRLYRIANNAADTFAGTYYLSSIDFKYNKK